MSLLSSTACTSNCVVTADVLVPTAPFGFSDLVASVEPAVVFTSVAKACVPRVADACVVTVEEDESTAYRISEPADAATTSVAVRHWAGTPGTPAQIVRPGVIVTPILDARRPDERRYRGVVEHRWQDQHLPTGAELALTQLVVQLAVALISQERLSERLAQHQEYATNLRRALESNREIGAAMGILMASRGLSEADAFSELRNASQASNRKLREVASEVVFTGVLHCPLTIRTEGVR